MHLTLRGKCVLLLLLCVVSWYAATAYAAYARARYAHPAIVRCVGWAEDSAAHVRLVSFARDGRAVYRCERHGY